MLLVCLSSDCHAQYYILGDLNNNRHLFLHSSRSWKFEIRHDFLFVLFWFVLFCFASDDLLQMVTLCLHLHMVERESSDFSYYKATDLITSKRLHLQIPSHLQLGLQHMNFEVHNSIHSKAESKPGQNIIWSHNQLIYTQRKGHGSNYKDW